jgi:ABC-type multidrug transport system fused ATPase/permease subunit
MFIASLLELASLGLIIPIAGLFLETPGISNNIVIEKFSNFLSVPYGNLILYLLLFFLIFYIVKIFYLVFVSWYEQKFLASFAEKLSSKIFFNYISQNFSFFVTRNSSEFLRNLTTEIQQATAYLSSFSKLLLESLIITALFIFLIILNPITTISAFFVFLFFSIIYIKLLRTKLITWGKQRQEDTKKRIQFMQEGFGAVKDIKLLGREKFFFDKFKLHNINLARVSLKIGFFNNMPRFMTELFSVFIVIFVFFVLHQSENNIGEIVTVMAVYVVAAFKIIPSTNRIIASVQSLKFNYPAIDALYQESKSFKFSNDIKKQNFIFNKNIIINIENFKHSKDSKFDLNNIKFEIKRGEKIGIIGPSGSGKSTLIDIISGILKLEKGDIKVDEKSIFSNLRGWQDLIGYIPQKIFILDDSLRNNIIFGIDKNKVDEEILLKLLHKINLTQLLERLPKGLDSKLGEKGLNISAGEIQRIGIARSLIYNPKILFLDEATSSLDTFTERQILKELNQFEDKTFISIAHRINTLKNCDKIYRLDKGTIIDSGNFERFNNF